MSKPREEIPEQVDQLRVKYTRWQPIFLVQIYKLAKAGLSDEAIARAMGIGRNTIKQWKKQRSEVSDALQMARTEVPPEDCFVRYFYQQLDQPLQELWDKIQNNDQVGGGIARLNAILADHGRRARQALFLHALVNSHYSPTRAMEKVGIDKRQLDSWTQTDPDFADLINEIDWHKGNFFEEALVKLVEQGNMPAILFANRGYNKKRGYGAASDVNVNVSGEIKHTASIDLADLDLSPEVRLAIVKAVREREQRAERGKVLSRQPPEERGIRQLEELIVERSV